MSDLNVLISKIELGELYPGDEINWTGEVAKISNSNPGRKFTIFVSPDPVILKSESTNYVFEVNVEYEKEIECNENGEAIVSVTLKGNVPLDAPFDTYSATIEVKAVG